MLARMARKASALALPALVMAIGLPLVSAAPAAATACPDTDLPAAGLSLEAFDASIFCQINETRAANGVQRLRPNPLLRRAAVQSLRPNPLIRLPAVSYTNSLLIGIFFSHPGDFAGHPNSSTPIGRAR